MGWHPVCIQLHARFLLYHVCACSVYHVSVRMCVCVPCLLPIAIRDAIADGLAPGQVCTHKHIAFVFVLTPSAAG